MKVTVTLQFCQDLVLPVFWILKWLLNFLTCNSLMNCEVKHIFIFYLFCLLTSSFVRWMFRSLINFWVTILRVLCIFWNTNLLPDMFLICFLSLWLDIPLSFSVYFVEVLILISFNLSIILFCILCFWCFIKKKESKPMD